MIATVRSLKNILFQNKNIYPLINQINVAGLKDFPDPPEDKSNKKFSIIEKNSNLKS